MVAGMTDTRLTPAQAERHARLREERAIVAPHRGMVEWRVIIEFVLTFAAFWGAIVLAATDTISLWIAFPICTVASAMIYMPLHEATHMNISGDNPRLNWLDEVIGRLSGSMFAFGFREHRISHMLHHAHTNELGRDPDMVTAGSLWRLPGTFLLSTVMSLLTPLFFFVPPLRTRVPKFVIARLGAGAARGAAATRLASLRNMAEVALLIVFSIAGFAAEAWILWYAATRLALMWVAFIFGWFPHHPHQETERYRDTRTATFVGSTLLIRGHDHHLLHHLYPRVAHYRLPDLWSDIGPTLIERGARVEGRASPDRTPIIWK
jgi:beta-carotene hydroxylase